MAADAELSWSGGITITFSLADGYSKTDAFAEKINGSPVAFVPHKDKPCGKRSPIFV